MTIEPAQLRQRGDDVLADAVGEIFLLGLAAHVDEGQDGDGGRDRARRDAGCAARWRASGGGAWRPRARRRSSSRTSPTKRKPFRAMVRITALVAGRYRRPPCARR